MKTYFATAALMATAFTIQLKEKEEEKDHGKYLEDQFLSKYGGASGISHFFDDPDFSDNESYNLTEEEVEEVVEPAEIVLPDYLARWGSLLKDRYETSVEEVEPEPSVEEEEPQPWVKEEESEPSVDEEEPEPWVEEEERKPFVQLTPWFLDSLFDSDTSEEEYVESTEESAEEVPQPWEQLAPWLQDSYFDSDDSEQEEVESTEELTVQYLPDSLSVKVEKLEAENKVLKAENLALIEENEAFQVENSKLQDEITRLQAANNPYNRYSGYNKYGGSNSWLFDSYGGYSSWR